MIDHLCFFYLYFIYFYQKAILDLLYELVGLPQPEWTDEISVALDAVDPSDFQVRIIKYSLFCFHNYD